MLASLDSPGLFLCDATVFQFAFLKTTPRGIGVVETFEVRKIPVRDLDLAVPPGIVSLKTSRVHSHLSGSYVSLDSRQPVLRRSSGSTKKYR